MHIALRQMRPSDHLFVCLVDPLLLDGHLHGMGHYEQKRTLDDILVLFSLVFEICTLGSGSKRGRKRTFSSGLKVSLRDHYFHHFFMSISGKMLSRQIASYTVVSLALAC